MPVIVYIILLIFAVYPASAQDMPSIGKTAPVHAEILDDSDDDLDDYVPPTMFSPQPVQQANPVQKAVSDDTPTPSRSIISAPTRKTSVVRDVPLPGRRPNRMRVSQEFLEKLKNRRKPGTLEDDVIETNANDILRQIDPKAATAPPVSLTKRSVKVQTQDHPRRTTKINAQSLPKNQNMMSIPFKTGTVLFDRAQAEPDLTILSRLNNQKSKNMRIELHGYAWHEDRKQALSLALGRAMSVRAYLIYRGINPDKIDVRAFGRKTNNTMTDRVDVIFHPVY